MTNDDLKQRLDAMSTQVEKSRAQKAATREFSVNVLADLPKITTDFNHKAMFLGDMCQLLDEKFGVGSTLGLDWLVDHYLAFEFERNVYPLVKEIHQLLRDKKHHYQNKLSTKA